jgi:predicted HTH transcriptional regulator
MTPSFVDLEREAQDASAESAAIDFKGRFDLNAKGDWCELIKDIVAMTNSGGGSILFGLDDDGQPTGLDSTEILRCDPADITNKLFS